MKSCCLFTENRAGPRSLLHCNVFIRSFQLHLCSPLSHVLHGSSGGKHPPCPSSASWAWWHSILCVKNQQQLDLRGQKCGMRTESLWQGPGELPCPLNLWSSSCFNARLQTTWPWPVPHACPCWDTAVGCALPLAVQRLCREHNATWGRNVAPKCDRSNLEEVELQG